SSGSRHGRIDQPDGARDGLADGGGGGGDRRRVRAAARPGGGLRPGQLGEPPGAAGGGGREVGPEAPCAILRASAQEHGMEIYENILETLGNTPLVKLGRFSPRGATLAAKIESKNPGASVKDRIGLAMITAGEEAGLLKPGGTIVEPTSGNT